MQVEVVVEAPAAAPTAGGSTSAHSNKLGLLALPTQTVEDNQETEIAKKGGMAAAIARTFVV